MVVQDMNILIHDRLIEGVSLAHRLGMTTCNMLEMLKIIGTSAEAVIAYEKDGGRIVFDIAEDLQSMESIAEDVSNTFKVLYINEGGKEKAFDDILAQSVRKNISQYTKETLGQLVEFLSDRIHAVESLELNLVKYPRFKGLCDTTIMQAKAVNLYISLFLKVLGIKGLSLNG